MTPDGQANPYGPQREEHTDFIFCHYRGNVAGMGTFWPPHFN